VITASPALSARVERVTFGFGGTDIVRAWQVVGQQKFAAFRRYGVRRTTLDLGVVPVFVLRTDDVLRERKEPGMAC
jgi:hypothetical protein